MIIYEGDAHDCSKIIKFLPEFPKAVTCCRRGLSQLHYAWLKLTNERECLEFNVTHVPTQFYEWNYFHSFSSKGCETNWGMERAEDAGGPAVTFVNVHNGLGEINVRPAPTHIWMLKFAIYNLPFLSVLHSLLLFRFAFLSYVNRKSFEIPGFLMSRHCAWLSEFLSRLFAFSPEKVFRVIYR